MAWIAPIAAAAAKRRREEEEEEMAVNLQAELGADWEFKIVRGSLGIFGNSEKLRQMLEDEARSGWEMAGKLDDNRVFLKRPTTARERDHQVEPGKRHERAADGRLLGRPRAAHQQIAGLRLDFQVQRHGPGHSRTVATD